MNKIYTLAEINQIANFKKQDNWKIWNSPENIKEIKSILNKDTEFIETIRETLESKKLVNQFNQTFEERLVGKSKTEVDALYNTIESFNKGIKADAKFDFQELAISNEDIWRSRKLSRESKLQKMADNFKTFSRNRKMFYEAIINSSPFREYSKTFSTPSTFIKATPSTTVSTSAIPKMVNKKGFVVPLVAGLAGVGLLATGLGVGIPLAVKSRKKKKEKKRIEKGKVKSYVRKGKLVKTHSRNYKPDK